MALALILRNSPKDDNGVDVLIGTGVAGALMAGWMVGSVMYWEGRHEEARRLEARTAPGVLESVQLVPGGSGRLVVVGMRRTEGEDGASQDFYRVDLVDAASGKRLVRRVFGEQKPECMPTAVGRLWCSANDQLLLALDLATLETVADWAEVRRRNPGLAEEPRGGIQIDPVGGAAVLPMPDGRSWRIDPTEFSARPIGSDEYAALEEALLGIDDEPSVATGSLWLSDEVWVGFSAPEGSQRARLSVGETAVSVDDFLSPQFVTDAATDGVPLRVPGSDALLVWHATTLDYKAAIGVLSAVTLDGRTVWTVQPQFKELELATVVGGLVVVVGGTRVGSGEVPGVALGLSAATGAVVWRLDT